MPEITIGIVGYGYWGPNLCRNFQSDDRVLVKYICDLVPERLNQTKRHNRDARLTSDYGDLLADKNLDAVVIATPVESHFDLAMQALRSGKHVFIEKPMCRNSEQCRALIAAADQNSLTLMVGYTFLYHGPVRLIKELIDREELGELFYFNSVRGNLGLFQSDVNVLWDLGVHDLSIVDYLFERTPVEVHAIGAAHTETDNEDVVYLTLKFEDNLIAHCQMSWLAPIKIRQIMIGGSKRMIVFDDFIQVEKVRVYDRGIETLAPPKTDRERYRNLVQYRYGEMRAPVYDITEALHVETRHFIDCILDKQTPLSDGHAGLRVTRLLELAERSLKTGASQSVAAQPAV
jgi:predicted dehydrogenase